MPNLKFNNSRILENTCHFKNKILILSKNKSQVKQWLNLLTNNLTITSIILNKILKFNVMIQAIMKMLVRSDHHWIISLVVNRRVVAKAWPKVKWEKNLNNKWKTKRYCNIMSLVNKINPIHCNLSSFPIIHYLFNKRVIIVKM